MSSTTTIHRETPREINKKERGEKKKYANASRRVAESGFAIRLDVYSAYLASLECEFNKVNKSF